MGQHDSRQESIDRLLPEFFLPDSCRDLNENFFFNVSGCGGSLTAAQGDIISPNYPMPYMHQAECYWRIAVAEGSLVRLIILDLELEHHNKCRYDYIEISEGMNRRNSERFCGKSSAKIIQRASNILNIKFHSDFTNSGRGFHLKYETRESIPSEIIVKFTL